MSVIAPADLADLLRGRIDLVADGDRIVPCRLPVLTQRPVLDPALLRTAWMPAGTRLDLVTDADALMWTVEAHRPTGDTRPAAPFDIEIDGVRRDRISIEGEAHLRVDDLPAGEHRVRIWLPQLGTVRLGPLRIEGGNLIRPAPAEPAWTCYGSSITHCSGAAGPSETWPALVAGAHGWDLLGLGFAGQGHLDPSVARAIRDRPADLISICAGANPHAKDTFSLRSFAPALVGFIDTVRDRQPDTPITLMSPIVAPDREHRGNLHGITLSGIREEVHRVAETLRDRGDDRIFTIDGLDVFGPDDAHLLVADGLHPDPDGYRLIGSRMAEILAPYLR
jgi:lysophospholipase L1-like esterase